MFNKTHNSTVTFKKNNLIIDTGVLVHSVTLPTDIKQIEWFNKIIIARVNPKGPSFLNENIFGISHDGKIIWQIEKIEHVDRDSPYTGMSKENDLLSAYNWDGFDYLIDPTTGKIINRKFVK